MKIVVHDTGFVNRKLTSEERYSVEYETMILPRLTATKSTKSSIEINVWYRDKPVRVCSSMNRVASYASVYAP